MTDIHLKVAGSNQSLTQPQPSGPAAKVPAVEVLDESASLQDRIVAALKTVYDPEIPVSIYELGLIYGIDIQPSGDVRITMTLTSPACPMAQELPGQVRSAIGVIPQVKDVDVEVVFDPPWNQEKMSDAAKLQLGLL